MRLILILLTVLGLLGFFGYRTYSYFHVRGEASRMAAERSKAQMAAAKEEEARKKAETPIVTGQQKMEGGVVASPVESSTIGNYVFKNRVVPPCPDFLRAESTRFLVQTDVTTNSWIWMGSPLLALKIQELAKQSDIAQEEFDLDFVFVLISEGDLEARGISIFHDAGASWLDYLSLSSSTGTLRLASGNWGVELNYQDASSGVALLSQPVVRVVDGEPWEFNNDQQVPVPQSDVVNGVVRTSLEYKTVGFGLVGMTHVVGDKIRLDCTQRNGAVTSRVSQGSSAPEFSTQSLKTSIFMSVWEWSCMGGIQVDREVISKGLFKRSKEISRDYMIVFVRPRTSLKAPPRAIPVGSATTQEHPLLPVKGWSNFPDEIRPLSLPLQEK